jgi:histidinol-phosphate/aromatic aminotransferase/cobyric acid decarboxylase-like protein
MMTAVPSGDHGGDGARLAAALGVDVDEVLDLSASLNPCAPDVAPIVIRHLDALDRYPDDTAAAAAVAEMVGVEAERLVLTNGGAEAIALVAGLHPVGWADDCDFSLYRRHLARCEPGAPRWMSDPNNPTGRLADADETAFVRDEAFYVLATGRWTRGDADCWVVGSLTKAFACPGLRMGYVIAPDDRGADAVRALRPRWSVGGLESAVLPDLVVLADPVGWRDGIAELRRQLVTLLADHGLTAEPAAANYVWIPDAPGLRDVLAAQRVLVRSGGSFGHPDAVRIAVPDERGLTRLAAALGS